MDTILLFLSFAFFAGVAACNALDLTRKRLYVPAVRPFMNADTILSLVEQAGEEDRIQIARRTSTFGILLPLAGAWFFAELAFVLYHDLLISLPFAVLFGLCSWNKNLRFAQLCRTYPNCSRHTATGCGILALVEAVALLLQAGLILLGIAVR